jgi:hypothetical protein
MIKTKNSDLRAKAARRALVARFRKLGLKFTSLDPVIRKTMERAAVSSGSVTQQVDSFVQVAEITEHYDVPEPVKREMVVRAYASYGESLSES